MGQSLACRLWRDGLFAATQAICPRKPPHPCPLLHKCVEEREKKPADEGTWRMPFALTARGLPVFDDLRRWNGAEWKGGPRRSRLDALLR